MHVTLINYLKTSQNANQLTICVILFNRDFIDIMSWCTRKKWKRPENWVMQQIDHRIGLYSNKHFLNFSTFSSYFSSHSRCFRQFNQVCSKRINNFYNLNNSNDANYYYFQTLRRLMANFCNFQQKIPKRIWICMLILCAF